MQPGLPVEVADAVGAGDAFTAALAMGMLAGLDLDVIGAHANRVAQYLLQPAGATPPMPPELRRFCCGCREKSPLSFREMARVRAASRMASPLYCNTLCRNCSIAWGCVTCTGVGSGRAADRMPAGSRQSHRLGPRIGRDDRHAGGCRGTAQRIVPLHRPRRSRAGEVPLVAVPHRYQVGQRRGRRLLVADAVDQVRLGRGRRSLAASIGLAGRGSPGAAAGAASLLDPRQPGVLQRAEVFDAVMPRGRRRTNRRSCSPSSRNFDVLLPPAGLDQELGQRIALGVERHDVGRILGHGEHLAEGDAAAGAEELDRASAGACSFRWRARRWWRPPSSAQRGSGRRKWLAKIMCVISCGRTESRSRSREPWIVIRQPNTSPSVETEGRGPAGPQVRTGLHRHHARLRPVGHRLAEPRDGQFVAILFGRLGHDCGEAGIGGFDDESWRCAAGRPSK